MTRAKHTISTSAARAVMVAALVAAAAMTGCVAEDMSNCPPVTPPATPTQEVLVVRVTDILSGADLTDTGRVIDASLMIFDADRNFVERVEITGEQLGTELEIPVSVATRAAAASAGEFYVSAWGNIAGNIDRQEQVSAGAPISSQFLRLKPSLTYSDNMTCPGEMFFGLKKITLGQGDTTRATATGDTIKIVHIVPITQRTARMAITVRGLPADATAEQYYFSLCEQNDGFTFEGTPMQNDMMCKIREQGVFNAAHEYVSPEPYWVIPSIDPENPHGCNAGVCLYKVGGGTRGSDEAGYINADGDMNITGKATMDTAGNHIALYAGQTTNVLFEFSPTGDFEVTVKYTPWNEVYQWSNW